MKLLCYNKIAYTFVYKLAIYSVFIIYKNTKKKKNILINIIKNCSCLTVKKQYITHTLSDIPISTYLKNKTCITFLLSLSKFSFKNCFHSFVYSFEANLNSYTHVCIQVGV